ncbi:AMP-dependent synthetase/ligase [Xylanimonas ulmi]|uniref:Acyl-CoA synthetase n=1 Tax=Xylanimonas ulmi TaxID=228973 RepID=A0A4Q7M122_9MICO|nr:AMP-dependent synthetase/ligase [Xylanibacterium ulmi]RZS60613.1 long-chain acyl-CoA synthetase [Xylanibacterium ulmi]
MLETTTPLRLCVPPSVNIDAILRERLRAEPDAVLAEVRRGDAWEPVTVAEFDAQVTAVAKGLVALGVDPGDTVGILSRTRYEWTLLDFAAWAAGAVPVPIYETSSAEQVHWILANSGISLLVVESDANAATVASVRDRAPMCREVLVLDPQDGGAGAIAALTAAGAHVPDAEVERRRRLATTDDLATIIYTSGTTGRPKGVELTHGNFTLTALNTVADVPEVFNGQGRAMLFLPLAHVFARFIEVIAVAGGSVLGHCPDVRDLVASLKQFQPTYVLGVPRIFEKVYNAAEQSSAAEKARGYFNWATAVAIAYSRALDTPRGPSLWLRFQRLFADGLVYSKLRGQFGGKAKYAVSGGGPLGERLGHFYRGVGINIIEGYGLTECTAPTSVNRPGGTRIGSVGTPLPGCSARIAEDGEILLRGPHIFRGYHNDPAATAEAFDGEWFRTGDLGAIDEDGFLSITGRKKEIIITAGGKNVAPAVLEDRVRAHALVSQCVVVGDNRPFIGALITLDPEGLAGWLTMHGKPSMTVEQAMTDPDVLASLDAAVARANEAVSKAESIRKHRLLTGDFTIANGYLTPSMKVKRAVVLADFADDVEALYSAGRDREPAAAR